MGTVEPIREIKDIKRIEKYLAKQSEQNLLLFTLGINCGLRISDILSLNIEDVRNKNANDEPLFMSRQGNRMERTAAYRIINKACKSIGIEGLIGTHTLRKTFGYHHYQKFKDVVILQMIFNHSTPEVTLRYIGIEEDEIFESYENFIL